MNKFIFFFLAIVSCLAQATTKTDLYSCPTLSPQNSPQQHGVIQHAFSISLFDGNPSELAELKPDNADTEDTGPAFWSMALTNRTYWFVCNYENGRLNYPLAKTYTRCTNVGSKDRKESLKCR